MVCSLPDAGWTPIPADRLSGQAARIIMTAAAVVFGASPEPALAKRA